MTSVLRFIDQHLAAPSSQGLGATLHARALAYTRAETIVRAYYAVAIVWVVSEMSSWPRLIEVDAADPQWPALWLEHVDLQRGIQAILIGYVVAALLAAMAPSWRLARLAYFVMLLQYLAVQNGFGKVNHASHAWLFVSAVFVLLPDRRWRGEATTRAAKSYFLSVVAAAQVVVLFLYTLTGLWKILFALNDLATSRVSGFELKGFSYIVADRLLATNQSTLLGEFFVHNHLVGWVLYTGTIYLEVRVAPHRLSAPSAPRLGHRAHPVPPRDPAGHGLHVPPQRGADRAAVRRVPLRAGPPDGAGHRPRPARRSPRPPPDARHLNPAVCSVGRGQATLAVVYPAASMVEEDRCPT